jgi:hypothetical protein
MFASQDSKADLGELGNITAVSNFPALIRAAIDQSPSVRLKAITSSMPGCPGQMPATLSSARMLI